MNTYASNAALFITDHWRGQNSLLITLLVTVLALRITVGSVQQLVPEAATLPWVVASALLLVWQSVGALRAGDHCLRVRGSTSWYWSAIATVFIAGVLTLVQIVDALSANQTPQINPVANIEPLPVYDNGTVVVVQGNLDWPLRRAFLKSLEQYPGVTTVQLQSEGGLVFVARALALKIAEAGLNTTSDGNCYSACTIVFLAGIERSLGPHGSLGFHRYTMDGSDPLQAISVDEELQKDRENFAGQGVSEEFLRQMFKASHNEIWIPERAVLLQAGVLTE